MLCAEGRKSRSGIRVYCRSLCVQHETTAAQSLKWKMIDEKEEMVWEGELLVVMLISGKSKSLRVFVSLPACDVIR